jgi:hypothetical protein
MPRVCILKPHSRKPVEHTVDTKCSIGLTYTNFQSFTEARERPLHAFPNPFGIRLNAPPAQ